MRRITYVENSPQWEDTHVFEVDDSTTRAVNSADIRTWCRETYGRNTNGRRWRFDAGGPLPARHGPSFESPPAFLIDDPIDAIAFRLRWC